MVLVNDFGVRRFFLVGCIMVLLIYCWKDGMMKMLIMMWLLINGVDDGNWICVVSLEDWGFIIELYLCIFEGILIVYMDWLLVLYL